MASAILSLSAFVVIRLSDVTTTFVCRSLFFSCVLLSVKMDILRSLHATECIICLLPLVSESVDVPPPSPEQCGVVCYSTAARSAAMEESAFTCNNSQVVVLRCGHLFHALCYQQLVEYTPDGGCCCCPVCRSPVKEEPVELRLRPRPDQTPDCSEREAQQETRCKGMEDGDALVLVGQKQIGPPQAYCGRLQRLNKVTADRHRRLSGRSKALRRAHEILVKEVVELQAALTAAKQRVALLSGPLALEQVEALRSTAKDVKNSLQESTEMLAAGIRENAGLDARILKYTQRLEAMQRKRRR